MKCQIQWIDEQGKPTPDDNDAVGMAINVPHDYMCAGRMIHFEQREYPICADHAQMITCGDEEMKDWKFEPFV